MLDNNKQTESMFQVIPRRSLIVWVYSLKQLKVLRRYGIISHVSKKMKYVVLYMNEKDIENTEAIVKKLHFVRNVDRSFRPDVSMNFGENIGEQEVADDTDERYDVEESKTEITLVETTEA